MKTIIQTTLAVSLAVAFAAPVSANELDGNDPVVASFYRDLNREPTVSTGVPRIKREQDRLPEITRTALDGGDPVTASFERNLHYTPNATGEFLMSDVEQDCLPGLVRAALEEDSSSWRETSVARQY